MPTVKQHIGTRQLEQDAGGPTLKFDMTGPRTQKRQTTHTIIRNIHSCLLSWNFFYTLNRFDLHKEPRIILQVLRICKKLISNPVDSILISIDICRIRLMDPSLTIALTCKPDSNPIMALALMETRDVCTQIAIEHGSIIILARCPTLKLTAGGSKHKPILLKDAKVRRIACFAVSIRIIVSLHSISLKHSHSQIKNIPPIAQDRLLASTKS